MLSTMIFLRRIIVIVLFMNLPFGY